MLVLSGQRDETIMIGDRIEVTVVDVRGDKVRIGINAPTSIAVHRKEVYEAIRRENEEAARCDQRQMEDLALVRPGGTPRTKAPPDGTVVIASSLDALKCKTA
jgi:carbon storage regulator